MAGSTEHEVSQVDTECTEKGYEADCWGCGQHLRLAVVTPVFKCAWCGAISFVKNNPRKPRSWRSKLRSVRDRLLVIAVLVLILSIICGGVWAVFPVIFSSFSLVLVLHSVFTCALSFNVLFNFVLAASQPAGPPARIAWGKVGDVVPGSLEGYRYCVPCASPKPPRVHHCSTCACCVVDMDHHCPFIGNCVGAGNHRHFLLFLFFTCISTVYVFLMAVYAGIRVWPTMIRLRERPLLTEMGWQRGGAILASLLRALVSSQFEVSVRAIALIKLVIASLSVLLGVGVLLYQQLSMLYDGNGYIDSMQTTWTQGVLRGVAVTKGWVNLRKVFGNGNPAFWIAPKLHAHTDPHSRKSL